MPDMEKVIAGLTMLIDRTNDDICEGLKCCKIAKDALSLLKEQEAIFLRDGHHVRCMHCGEYWCDSDREGNPFPMNFCPHCGRLVKWE